MNLHPLIKRMPVVRVEGPTNLQIDGVTYDSRRVTPGALFVAVPGSNTDGHQHLPEAVYRGAVAVVVERGALVTPRVTRVCVTDSRRALAAAAAAYHHDPGSALKVVGITGTHGKTTAAFLLWRLIEHAGSVAGLISTVRYVVRDRTIPAHRTTPEAPELQCLLDAMRKNGCEYCVLEVSSHAIDQKRIDEIEFRSAVFTGLGRDHLDYHGTMDAYFAVKRELFVRLQRGARHGRAVVNGDDHHGRLLLNEIGPGQSLSYGMGNGNQVRASALRMERGGSWMTITAPGASVRCHLPLAGRHNVYNALAAVAVALDLGVPAEEIPGAFESMSPVPGRLERIDLGQPFDVYVDYAHTEESLRETLAALRQTSIGRLLLVFGCGGTRDSGKRAAMGQAAADLADLTVITTDNPRHELAETIAGQILEGYRRIRLDSCPVELDRRRAIREILGTARAGDAVLVAGKGHETCQEFNNTVVPFDDRVCVREALKTLGWGAPRQPVEMVAA